MSILADEVSENDHKRGDGNAPVLLVEYADFACPYSRRAHYIVRQLQQELRGLALVFRTFPLTQIRPHALPAALAAEAAARQGSFWEMHDMLFEQQDEFTAARLVDFARVLGLDIEQFIDDMGSDDGAVRVRRNFVSGIRSGVSGTPTFYINSRRHDDLYDYQTLKKAIEGELASNNRPPLAL